MNILYHFLDARDKAANKHAFCIHEAYIQVGEKIINKQTSTCFLCEFYGEKQSLQRKVRSSMWGDLLHFYSVGKGLADNVRVDQKLGRRDRVNHVGHEGEK